MACPVLWLNKRQGVPERPRVFHPALLAGTAFHAGMEAYLSGGTPQQALEAAVARDWPEGDTEGLSQEKVCAMVLGALDTAYVELSPGDSGMLACEVVLGGPPEEAERHGRYAGTSDLITENETGLTVTDFKTKIKIEPQYVDRELRETARSWQLKQYGWFAEKMYEKPVTKLRKLLVSLSQPKVWLYTHDVLTGELEEWHLQAQEVWWQMDCMAGFSPNVEAHPWRHEDACERYGWAFRCGYYGICWEGA
jgi:hypothetical protein